MNKNLFISHFQSVYFFIHSLVTNIYSNKGEFFRHIRHITQNIDFFS